MVGIGLGAPSGLDVVPLVHGAGDGGVRGVLRCSVNHGGSSGGVGKPGGSEVGLGARAGDAVRLL